MNNPKPTLEQIQQAIFAVQAVINNYEQGLPEKDYTPVEQAQRYEQAKKNLAQLFEDRKAALKEIGVDHLFLGDNQLHPIHSNEVIDTMINLHNLYIAAKSPLPYGDWLRNQIEAEQ